MRTLIAVSLALGTPGRDRAYAYTGLGLLEIRGGKILRQILYGDYGTLAEQLAAASPPQLCD